MKVRKEVNVVNEDSVTAKARLIAVEGLVGAHAMALPDDAVRIEIDIEYADGGRVKVEARS